MLKYINKQLSKNELHEVEKHLLDCEFCSDAFEGVKLAQNSSMLFAIDNKIDQRVRGVENNKPLMRNLMVAASLIIIVFGAYFTFNHFNSALENQTEFTVVEDVKEENEIPHSKFAPPVVSIVDKGDSIRELEDREEVIEELPKINVAANAERIIEKNLEEVLTEEDVIANESTVLQEEIMELYVESEAQEIDPNEMTIPRESPVSAMKKEDVPSSKSKKEKSRKVAKKSYSGNTYTMYTYKIYDYAEEYQQEYDFKKSAQPRAVEADFANEEEKNRITSALEKTRVEVTYKEVLEQGVKYLKDHQYNQAKNQFDLILKSHPKDVNALFYGAICSYNIEKLNEALDLLNRVLSNNNDVFNEEAKWYKALTFVETDRAEAKRLLQEIIDDNGFYSSKAIDKLKTIE